MGRSGRLVTGRKVAGSNPGSPRLNCVSVLEQDTEPQIAPDMHSPCDEPCDELATCPGCTQPLPRDSWDWLQQNPPRPHKKHKAVTDDDMT